LAITRELEKKINFGGLIPPKKESKKRLVQLYNPQFIPESE